MLSPSLSPKFYRLLIALAIFLLFSASLAVATTSRSPAGSCDSELNDHVADCLNGVLSGTQSLGHCLFSSHMLWLICNRYDDCSDNSLLHLEAQCTLDCPVFDFACDDDCSAASTQHRNRCEAPDPNCLFFDLCDSGVGTSEGIND